MHEKFLFEFLKDILTGKSNGIKLSFLLKMPPAVLREKNAVNLIK